jgi:hypothetical protein
MNIFSELYLKHLARTLFFLSIGVSSSMGQHLLTKNILMSESTATLIAVLWAALLIVIYSYFVADRERQFIEMETSFNYMRVLKPDNKIGARLDNPAEAIPPKSSFSKIEIQHSMDPMIPQDKLPEFLKNEEPKAKK